MTAVVTKATPAPGLKGRRARPEDVAAWTPAQREVYSCRDCKTPYRAGSGANWVCEHWHERGSSP